jgi:mono/diheme cytochrome c family protein
MEAAVWRVGILGGALLCASGTFAWAQPGDPVAGRTVAVALCSNCHVVPGLVRGPVPDAVPTFAVIARKWSDAAALADRLIAPPHPEMPAPPLGNRQRLDVAAWILSLRE